MLCVISVENLSQDVSRICRTFNQTFLNRIGPYRRLLKYKQMKCVPIVLLASLEASLHCNQKSPTHSQDQQCLSLYSMLVNSQKINVKNKRWFKFLITCSKLLQRRRNIPCHILVCLTFRCPISLLNGFKLFDVCAADYNKHDLVAHPTAGPVQVTLGTSVRMHKARPRIK